MSVSCLTWYWCWSPVVVLTPFLVSLRQAQDYITAGACMALGLRFAGSANSDAFDCLYELARTFMKIMSFAGTAAAVRFLSFNVSESLSGAMTS